VVDHTLFYRFLLSFILFLFLGYHNRWPNPCLCDLALELPSSSEPQCLLSDTPCSLKFPVVAFFFLLWLFQFSFSSEYPRVIGFCMISSFIRGLSIILRCTYFYAPSWLPPNCRTFPSHGVLSLRSRDRHCWLRIQTKVTMYVFPVAAVRDDSPDQPSGNAFSETT